MAGKTHSSLMPNKHLTKATHRFDMAESPARAIIADLLSQKDPVKGAMVAGYMKTSKLEFHGVLVSHIRRTAREHIKRVPLEQLPALVERLWQEPVFEPRMAGVEILEKYSKEGSIGETIAVVSRLLDLVDTWSLVDPLCIVSIGNLMIRSKRIEDMIADWRTSDNVWRRRATILPYVQLAKKKYYKKEYANRIFRGVSYHLSDSEFFVAKAVGWALRELSKSEPELVRTFIDKNRNKMVKLAIREGSKKLKR